MGYTGALFLGHRFLLIYLNDSPEELHSPYYRFADDLNLVSVLSVNYVWQIHTEFVIEIYSRLIVVVLIY